MQIYVDNSAEAIQKSILNNKVLIGAVRTFENIQPDKDQAKKVLEEAAELYGAWESLNKGESLDFENLEDEACDLLTATCNLLAAFGIRDIQDAMRRCEKRNTEKGRFDNTSPF